jgi:hypothetical protein
MLSGAAEQHLNISYHAGSYRSASGEAELFLQCGISNIALTGGQH